MKIILNNKLNFFAFSFLITLLIYFPTFNSGPIWDDHFFHFQSKVITDKWSLQNIITNFSWAVSVIAQKILFNLFGVNFIYYHFTNFLLHFVNAILFMQLLRINHFKFSQWAFLAFLLHPSMISSVAWMIQFKTLLCAFFGLLSLNLISLSYSKKDLKKKVYKFSSLISFMLSLGSKASSVPLIPASMIIKQRMMSKKVLALATVLIVFASLRLINSPVTQEGIQAALATSQFSSISSFILTAIPQTLSWYFWQASIPLVSIPIRGPMPMMYAETIVGFFTMIIFFYIIRKNKIALKFLLAALVMLLPYLGIIPAPFMTSAWVSDQHLYLVMIFFIPALSLIIESIPKVKMKTAVRVLSLVYFASVSVMSIDNYKSEYNFFRSSFNYNHNIAAGFHLINYHLNRNEVKEAQEHYYFLISTTRQEKSLSKNLFWAQLLLLEPILLKPLE